MRYSFGRRVRAMCRSERVVDIEVPELRQPAGESLVVRLLAAEKSRVLEEDDVRIRIVRRLRRLVGIRALDEDDVLLRQQLAETTRHRSERVFLLGLSLRSTQVRK